MEGTYEVRFGNRVVGNVEVRRQGLYYRFCCRCNLSGDVICRLCIQLGKNQQDLGILVPLGEGFGMDTKLPVKRLGEGKPEFTLIPKHAQVSMLITPVYPEEPFAYIERLKDAFLVRKADQLHICIKEPGR